MTHIDALAVAGAVTGAAGLVTTLAWAAKAAWSAARRAAHIADRILGEPATSTAAARPGLLDQVDLLTADMVTVKAELTPDHGLSIKDTITRIDRQLAEHIRNAHTHP